MMIAITQIINIDAVIELTVWHITKRYQVIYCLAYRCNSNSEAKAPRKVIVLRSIMLM
jgi:hypothetical protein